MSVKTSATKGKIIVCDDDPDILDVIIQVLEQEGFSTIAVKNSAHLFQQIDEFRPDLLIVDLWMPQFNGDDIIHHLKTNPLRSTMSILLLSASVVGNRVAAHAGADAFLAKPFEIEQLVHLSKRLIHTAKTEN